MSKIGEFTKPRENLILSRNGFSMEALDRFKLLYSEGDHHLVVEIELLVGSVLLGIYSDSIDHWQPPYEGEAIEEQEKNRILKNLERAFAYDGAKIAIL